MTERLAILGGAPVRATLLPYARQTIETDDIAAVSEVLASDWITQGPTLARFERGLAERAGVAHAVAFSSGTAALHAACWAAGLGPGDEAITTPLTFAATANAVVYQGAKPVFADIDGTTLNLDPDAVKRVATPRTRALLPVDFAGLPCEYERLLPLAREHGWTVIADAAHSFGGAYGDRPVGALADMTALSFHPAKLITSGEGGAVVTDRTDLAERLRRMRHHGIRYADSARPWRNEIEVPGNNYRLTDFQSALGLSQLAKLDRFWERRDGLARRYRERLTGSPSVELPTLPADRRHGWHLFVVLLRLERLAADQDTILQALRAENIGVTLHYPLVHLHPFYRERFGYGPGLCPVAESVERRLVTLPLFPSMTDGDQDDVLRALDKVFAHYARVG
ncbi:MAG: aminotransferase class I/II-fold pyridoxal phosphate-dependent enzyme [candidate division NC10 bacterium]|nr:aminotransferase class I/II-fold pyridoxal phosphate-dependent enzyme [candidate division NC10 bacterium]